eukprot:CAMPEP_0169478970 /NCGR_PEP_ID=MMETSP1042-20121227/28764_1 /TAXON_ID=464988 /ORGANISM="Hemiselmis andersenii, Strain CCMP1180" /LENGTH=78 /DNA_ID=CAMNT_0009593483 /DNA_START=246 /DNA_END=478 /DNA_ORIENTATION=+
MRACLLTRITGLHALKFSRLTKRSCSPASALSTATTTWDPTGPCTSLLTSSKLRPVVLTPAIEWSTSPCASCPLSAAG